MPTKPKKSPKAKAKKIANPPTRAAALRAVPERVRTRNALLEAAGDRLAEAFAQCLALMPAEDIAFYLVGDARGVADVAGGHRDAIADLLLGRVDEAVVADLRGYLAKREAGFVPCLCCVGLASGGIDVSVVALKRDEDRDRVH